MKDSRDYPTSFGAGFAGLTTRCLAVAGAVLAAGVCGVSVAQAATNVLGNPGFETGSITGWTGYGGGVNPNGAAVESTNNFVYGSGTIHVTTHSGTYTGKDYGQFVGYNNTSGIYQDAGTGPGSVWSADGWASTQAPDNITGLNQFWFEVSFRDAANTILALYRSSPINTNTPVGSWINYPVTNQIDLIDMTTIMGTATSYSAPAGTTKVRFQVVFSQNVYDGGSVYFDDLNLNKIASSDPEISTPPASQTRVVGQAAIFAASASGQTALSYSWTKGFNPLSDGGRISGATTSTLTVSNVVLADADNYTVTVTDNAGSQDATAQLKVVSVAEVGTNRLVNSSLEDGVFSLPWESGWQNFNGTVLASTNDFYFLSATNVSTVEGTNCVQLYSTGPGSYNGFFQDKPVVPGEIYTAGGWMLTPFDDAVNGANNGWIEVQFRNAGGTPLMLFKSAVISSNSPVATWLFLETTNVYAGDFVTALGSSREMVVPPGAATARVQVNYLGQDGGGSLYADAVNLTLRAPVFAAARNGGSIDISFATYYGTTYRVLYKANLTDATWQLLTSVVGDGNVRTVTDPANGARRFYVVNAQ